MNKYADENDRLDQENDALRGGKQLLEMEHAQALEQVTELTERLNSLEHTFLNDPDGTADAFGFGDARGADALHKTFPDFPGGSSAKRSLDLGNKPIKSGPGGGGGGGRKPVPIDKRAPWQK